jgi:HAD superfamily hydrolase (TIGR01509 family)
MVKAMVFDLGGVLFAEGKSVALEKLSHQYGYDGKIVGAILSSPQSFALRKGLLSDGEFWTWAREQLPPTYDAELIKERWYSGYELDPNIFHLISELRDRYKIIAFSGNIRSRVDFLEQKYHFRHLFHLEIYSFDHRVTKPDREFVKILIAKSGMKSDELVYVDDNEAYARPARELGIKAVIYTRGQINKLRDDLRQFGIQVSRGSCHP